MTMISTRNSGFARRASVAARAGAFSGSTQASQTAFISANLVMSVTQIVADSNFDLSVPASAKSRSILARIASVCAAMVSPVAS